MVIPKRKDLNLYALVAEDDKCSLCFLPTNADALLIFPQYTERKNEDIMVGNFYVTLIREGSWDTWYIVMCEGNNDDGTYKIETTS